MSYYMIEKCLNWFNFNRIEKNFNSKENDLHRADNGEASEEPHGSPQSWHLGHKVRLLVPGDLVKGRGVEVDVDPVELRVPLEALEVNLHNDVRHIHIVPA